MTPRPYLSRFSMLLWESSRKRWFEYYFGSAKKFGNRGMDLGTEVADAMKNDEETGDFGKDLVISQMPKCAIRDQSFIVTLGKGKDAVPILIKPDGLSEDWMELDETKTGSELDPWTQRKVDDDPQLTFYATGIYIEKKKIPSKIRLAYAPTEMILDREDGIEKPRLTGEVKIFHTQRHMSEILNMMVRMRKAWREINAACEARIA